MAAATGDVPVSGPQTPAAQFGFVNDELVEVYKRAPFRLTNYGGTSDAITADGTPFNVNLLNGGTNALLDGQLVLFTAQAANTGTTPTLAIDSVAAKTIVAADSGALGDGEIVSGVDYILKYESTPDHLRIIARGSHGWFWRAEQATTSGTEFDFTDIPATAREIVLALEEVGTDGSDGLLVQLGDSGGIETTGYVATATRTINGANPVALSSTSGFPIVGAAGAFSGHMRITRADGDSWIASHAGKITTTSTGAGGGSKTLSATLTQVRLTRTGTDTFDAGAVSLGYMLDI